MDIFMGTALKLCRDLGKIIININHEQGVNFYFLVFSFTSFMAIIVFLYKSFYSVVS